MGFIRRSGRLAKEIRILLIGTDTSGRVFAEETLTVTLSRHGAGIISKHKLAADGILILRFLGGSSEVSIRLVGELGEDVRGYIYGVAFVDPTLDFWELKLPPPPAWRMDFEAPLQCISCKNCEVVDPSEVEADVYAMAEFILRFCSNCGMTTQWRRLVGEPVTAPAQTVPAHLESSTHAAAPPSPPIFARHPPLPKLEPYRRLPGVEVAVPELPPPEPLPPAATASLARGANRRRDVRTRVSFTACIRVLDAEEIVECGNISKGGFSFRSRKAYLVGSDIDVALPYYPGTPPAFVRATIRHAMVLPNDNFHYGAKYAASSARPKS